MHATSSPARRSKRITDCASAKSLCEMTLESETSSSCRLSARVAPEANAGGGDTGPCGAAAGGVVAAGAFAGFKGAAADAAAVAAALPLLAIFDSKPFISCFV